MDSTARAHELIEVTESLTALIEQENELLQELGSRRSSTATGKDLAVYELRNPGYRRIQLSRLNPRTSAPRQRSVQPIRAERQCPAPP